MDGTLDFDSEDSLLASPVFNKKRKKAIGLDDLLSDYYKEKSKIIQKESKKEKSRKNYSSDEEDHGKEAKLSEAVDECHNKMKELAGDEDMSVWGMEVFREQKSPPTLSFPELKSCDLLQAFMDKAFNSMVELGTEEGDAFLEGLLLNGWLSELVSKSDHLEKSIAAWIFNTMLYSSREDLMAAACEFWTAFLSPKSEGVKLLLKVGWYPNYSDLRKALDMYGFMFNLSSATEPISTDSYCWGPPQNLRAWIKFVAVCCQIRDTKSIFLVSEAEELLEVIVLLFLDRRFLGLMVLIYECMQSLINYFTEKEWTSGCEKIAKSLASRIPKDLNSLRVVECISGDDTRSKQLKGRFAYQVLLMCFDDKASDEEGILQLLILINVKEKSCDLSKVFIYLVLTENLLLACKTNQVVEEMWGLFLRNCSCRISSTDLRSYASKVRNKASFILQGSSSR